MPGSIVISSRRAVMQSMQAGSGMSRSIACREAEICKVSRWAPVICEGLAHAHAS